jgi:ATP-GRASP peptide maturase of grasp-with-spasm system
MNENIILIVTSEEDDTSIEILRWLDFFNKKYHIINENSFVENILIDISNDGLLISTKYSSEINLSKISKVWYRRGYFRINDDYFDENNNSKTLNAHYKKEWEITNDYLFYLFNKEKLLIGDFSLRNINKLMVLDIAIQIGLNVPQTIITNGAEQLRNFVPSTNKISKTIGEIITEVNTEKKSVTQFRTKKVDLNIIPEFFFPSLFQERLIKQFEIRSFIIKKRIYSMAILSQADENTKDDFRNYDTSKKIRYVPFKLPNEIVSKLFKLSKLLKLSTCSVDLVKCTSGNIYFLEVNPIGQFGMVSEPCNYYIERQIAKEIL